MIANLDQFVDRIISALIKKYDDEYCLLMPLRLATII